MNHGSDRLLPNDPQPYASFTQIRSLSGSLSLGRGNGSLFNWNQKADDLGTWYVGCEAYQVCSNYDPRLTLTYLTSRSNFAS